MEHVVQFAISIDDEYITKRLQERGYDDVITAIKNKAFDEMNHRMQFDYSFITQFMNEHKDEIIERAVNNITASIKNSKKYKEALSQVAEEMLSE